MENPESGQYGCVFYPPLKCPDIITLNPNIEWISKIFNADIKGDYVYELREPFSMGVVSGIDPNGIFSVGRNWLMCAFDESDPRIRNCKFKNIMKMQLIQEKFGQSLEMFKLFPDIKDTIKSLSRIFYALAVLYDYGFCHMDLHWNNVLFSDKDQAFKIIDWGSSTYRDQWTFEDFKNAFISVRGNFPNFMMENIDEYVKDILSPRVKKYWSGLDLDMIGPFYMRQLLNMDFDTMRFGDSLQIKLNNSKYDTKDPIFIDFYDIVRGMKYGSVAGQVGAVEAWERYLALVSKYDIKIPTQLFNYHAKIKDDDARTIEKIRESISYKKD
jgi:hypothetical protein